MDYTRLATNEAMKQLNDMTMEEIREMSIESEFLQQCYENHAVILLEAEKGDLMHDIIVAFQKFVSKFAEKFRQNSIRKFKSIFDDKSCQRIRDNIGTVKANCKKLETQKTTPLWDGKWDTDANTIRTSVNNAFNNVSNGKFDDYSFASTFIKDTTMVKTQDTRMANYLKNYFRYGDNDMETPESITVTGKDVADKLEDILRFIEAYPTTVADTPGKISDDINKRAKSVKIFDATTGEKTEIGNASSNELKDDGKTSGNTETFMVTPNTYLNVEQKAVCETLLPLFMGYTSIVEAKKNNNKAKNRKKTKPQTTTGAGDNADENKPANNDEKVDNTQSEDEVKVTGGLQEDPKNADKNEAEAEKKDEEEKKEDNKGKDYLKDVTHFFQYVVTSYSTSLEERFISYSKILMVVAKDYIKEPDNNKDKKEKKK